MKAGRRSHRVQCLPMLVMQVSAKNLAFIKVGEELGQCCRKPLNIPRLNEIGLQLF